MSDRPARECVYLETNGDWKFAHGGAARSTKLLLCSSLCGCRRLRDVSQARKKKADRPAKRVEQVGLIVMSGRCPRARGLGTRVEDVGDLEPELRTAQPRVLERHLGMSPGWRTAARSKVRAGEK